MSKHKLRGCKTTPSSSYLKALGLLRIISKKDPSITACWENNNLILDTEMSKEEIIEYLSTKYGPTPVISPWSYDKFQRTRTSLQDLIKSERFRSYNETLTRIDHIFEKFRVICKLDEITKADVDHNKELLLKLCRNYLPNDVIPWLDAVYVTGVDKPHFAPILGSGANDGNFDISENFVKHIIKVLSMNKESVIESKKWLESALFGNIVNLEKMTTVGHNTDGTGGPNSGVVGFKGKSLSNPWDYILMIEGTILFAGNLSKHLSSNNTDKAVFPFTANTSNVGYAAASINDSDEGKDAPSRGELWLPIWESPATYKEIKHIFNEGRIQLGKKPAKTGTEFARAIITLGVERGISKFQRYCILKRKGKAHLTIDAGMIHVADEPTARLLDELDKWYNAIITKSKKHAPETLLRLIRDHDESIIKFCAYRKKQNLLQLLITLGKLERYISRRADFEPLQKLSDQWLVECYDGSVEFRLAASIASIKNVNSVGGIRENLENIIQEKNGSWKHKKDAVSSVWKENDNLLKNMSRILQRRSLDGKIKSHDIPPIKGIIHAKINDIVKFLNGDLDIKKISDLILPLSVIDITSETEYPWKQDLKEDTSLPLPEAYMIIKLIYPSNKNEKIPYDLSVLNMLSSGRIDDAYAKASYILHAHRLSPLRYSKETGNATSTSLSDVVKEHLLASLLFPILDLDRKLMLKSVTV